MSRRSKKLNAIRDELRDCTTNTGAGITRKVDNARAALRRGITGARTGLDARIDEAHTDLAARIDESRSRIDYVRESIAIGNLWSLTRHITLAATLLLIIARGFHWI